MGEVVITCAKCGTRRAFHGSKWESRLRRKYGSSSTKGPTAKANKRQPGRLSPSERAPAAAVPLGPSCTGRNRRVARALHGITTGGVAAGI